MAWEQVAEGGPFEFASGLAEYDNDFEEGQRGLLQLQTLWHINPGTVQAALVAAGIPNTQVTGSGNQLNIFFRKEYWWLPVIIIALIVLAIVIASWQLSKEIDPVAGSLLAGGFLIATVAALGIAALFVYKGFKGDQKRKK